MKTRREIMDLCPEEFEEKLNEYIADIETEVLSIKGLMEITSPDDLDDIIKAYDKIKKLEKKLY